MGIAPTLVEMQVLGLEWARFSNLGSGQSWLETELPERPRWSLVQTPSRGLSWFCSAAPQEALG